MKGGVHLVKKKWNLQYRPDEVYKTHNCEVTPAQSKLNRNKTIQTNTLSISLPIITPPLHITFNQSHLRQREPPSSAKENMARDSSPGLHPQMFLFQFWKIYSSEMIILSEGRGESVGMCPNWRCFFISSLCCV